MGSQGKTPSSSSTHLPLLACQPLIPRFVLSGSGCLHPGLRLVWVGTGLESAPYFQHQCWGRDRVATSASHRPVRDHMPAFLRGSLGAEPAAKKMRHPHCQLLGRCCCWVWTGQMSWEGPWGLAFALAVFGNSFLSGSQFTYVWNGRAWKLETRFLRVYTSVTLGSRVRRCMWVMPISDLLYKCVWGLGCGFPEGRTQPLRSSVIPEPSTAQDTADVQSEWAEEPSSCSSAGIPSGSRAAAKEAAGQRAHGSFQRGSKDMLCCATGRILVPWLGIEPAPSAVTAWSPNHWTTGISQGHCSEQNSWLILLAEAGAELGTVLGPSAERAFPVVGEGWASMEQHPFSIPLPQGSGWGCPGWCPSPPPPQAHRWLGTRLWSGSCCLPSGTSRTEHMWSLQGALFLEEETREQRERWGWLLKP